VKFPASRIGRFDWRPFSTKQSSRSRSEVGRRRPPGLERLNAQMRREVKAREAKKSRSGRMMAFDDPVVSNTEIRPHTINSAFFKFKLYTEFRFDIVMRRVYPHDVTFLPRLKPPRARLTDPLEPPLPLTPRPSCPNLKNLPYRFSSRFLFSSSNLVFFL
jgi:hypothetical protein